VTAVKGVLGSAFDAARRLFIKKGRWIWKYGKRDIIFAAVLTTSLIKKG